MRIFLEPTEALLFRTGRPFVAGDDVYAESLFPPTPETLQGALRAAIAIHWDKNKTLDELFKQLELVDLIGDRKSYGCFRIVAIALGRRNKDEIESLFPAPAHILETQNEAGQKQRLRLNPQALEGVYSNLPAGMQLLLPDLPTKTDEKLGVIKGWLTEYGLHKALSTPETLRDEDIVKPKDIYMEEPRLGIGMQSTTKSTREGYLYQIKMIRMQPGYGFVVDIHLSQNAEGGKVKKPIDEPLVDDNEVQARLRLPTDGWITLGGERRAAHFEVLGPIPQGIVEPNRAGRLLYLATPSYFEGGWQPLEWPASLGKPIAAAIPRFLPVGGWILNPADSGGQSKDMHRCVPAGSVYFFEHSVTVSRPLTDYGWQIGYGIAYTGE